MSRCAVGTDVMYFDWGCGGGVSLCVDGRLVFIAGVSAGCCLVGVACSRGSSMVHWSPDFVELLSGGLGKVMSGGELVMIVTRMIGRSESSWVGWFKVCRGKCLGKDGRGI